MEARRPRDVAYWVEFDIQQKPAVIGSIVLVAPENDRGMKAGYKCRVTITLNRRLDHEP
jgi:hypothetical protein